MVFRLDLLYLFSDLVCSCQWKGTRLEAETRGLVWIDSCWVLIWVI